ncbi:MAG: hypothetical protein JWM96_575, partial [Alphaproteobacteria bacterium]|nr:hypothetical protein [Alphaproteobacteria bacterium]
MKIAILSDSHDHKALLKQALETIQQMNVKTLLFCGDFCAPNMLGLFSNLHDIKVEVVFGNNDGDRFRMATLVHSNYPHITLHGEYVALELDSIRVGMTHYPFYATAMAKSGDYDLVAFGHDHEARILEFGACL